MLLLFLSRPSLYFGLVEDFYVRLLFIALVAEIV